MAVWVSHQPGSVKRPIKRHLLAGQDTERFWQLNFGRHIFDDDTGCRLANAAIVILDDQADEIVAVVTVGMFGAGGAAGLGFVVGLVDDGIDWLAVVAEVEAAPVGIQPFGIGEAALNLELFPFADVDDRAEQSPSAARWPAGRRRSDGWWRRRPGSPGCATWRCRGRCRRNGGWDYGCWRCCRRQRPIAPRSPAAAGRR